MPSRVPTFGRGISASYSPKPITLMNLGALTSVLPPSGAGLLPVSTGSDSQVTWVSSPVMVQQVTAANINPIIASISGQSHGITIELPPGDFNLTGTTIDAASTNNITLRGQGSSYGGTRLKTTATSGSLIDAQMSGGFKLESIALYASHTGYVSPLLDLGSSGVGVPGAALYRLRDCNFTGDATGVVTNNVVDINNATGGLVEGCYFIGGGNALAGAHTPGDLCNGNAIGPANYFQLQTTTSVRNLHTGNLVHGNVFEPLHSGGMIAYYQDSTIPAYGLEVAGNYMGDVSAAASIMTVCGFGVDISGNFFQQSAGGSTAFGINVAGVDGLTVTGNTFQALNRALNLAAASTRVVYLGNDDATCTTAVVGRVANAGAGSIIDDGGTLYAKGGFTSF